MQVVCHGFEWRISRRPALRSAGGFTRREDFQTKLRNSQKALTHAAQLAAPERAAASAQVTLRRSKMRFNDYRKTLLKTLPTTGSILAPDDGVDAR
jgi:hypothetical protein